MFLTTGRDYTSGPTMTQDARGGSLLFGTPSNHVSGCQFYFDVQGKVSERVVEFPWQL